MAEENNDQNTLGQLERTVAGVQQAFSTTYAGMVGSLQQSVAMMSRMNEMMEGALTQSLRIETRFLCGGAPLALVVVSNLGRLPLQGISIVCDGASCSMASTAPDASSRTADLLSLPRVEMGKDEDGTIASCAAFDLLGGQKRVFLLASEFSAASGLASRHCTVTCSLPSPGTGSTLTVSRSFALPVLCLCTCTRTDSAPQETLSEAERTELDVATLRTLFHIPALDAIPEGAKFAALLAGKIIMLIVVEGAGAHVQDARVALYYARDEFGKHLQENWRHEWTLLE